MDILLAVMLTLTAVFVLWASYQLGAESVRKEAVSYGAAEYVVKSPDSQRTKFIWKTH